MSVTVTHGNLFSQLNDLAAGIRNNAAQAIKVATDAAYQDAKTTTMFKDRSGDLRGSIAESVDGLEGKVWRGRKKYFGFVANGTVPHVIEGRNGGMLAFMMNGSMMFRRRVNHPGTAPRPVMQHAYDRGAFVADMVGDRFINAAIQRFNRAA
jgi:hypothetical protein